MKKATKKTISGSRAEAATKTAVKKRAGHAKAAVKSSASLPKARKMTTTVKRMAEPARPREGAKAGITKAQEEKFRDMLMSVRERVANQVRALKGESLTRPDEVNTAEDGTDAFDRQFALSLASSENDSLFEIDEALQRLHEGRYGVCEDCQALIEAPRLMALPFVRLCIKCQSAAEKGKVRHNALSVLRRL